MDAIIPKTKSGWLAVSLLTLAVLGVGCSKGWYHVSPVALTGFAPKDRITVIVDEHPEGEDSRDIEEDVVECIEDGLEDTLPTVQIVPSDKFRQVAFAGLTPEEIASSAWSWETLLRDPAFRDRVAPLNIRYLIAVSVSEWSTPKEAEFALDRSGLWGVVWKWERWASMDAEVVDFVGARRVGTVQAGATGKSAMGFIAYGIFPLPIGWPSFPYGTACDELAEGVAKFLAGENLPEEIGIWPDVAEESLEEIGAGQFEEAPDPLSGSYWPPRPEEGATPTPDVEALDWASSPCC